MITTLRLDKDRLEELAKVTFTWSDVEDFVEICTDYSRRFRGPIPDFMLYDSPITRQLPETIELEARRAFVEAVEGIYRERVRRRGGSAYNHLRVEAGDRAHDPAEPTHTGPLIDLLQELFRAMNEPDPPSAATLHHDLEFIRTHTERDHGGKSRRGKKAK
jgi:hypothetical protein